MRARAVYSIALVFLFSQVFNLGLMWYTYGHWTLDHTIALIVMAAVSVATLGLRYTKKFALFAGFFSCLFIGAIASSAIQDFTGINSSLIIFLLLGAVINGFISGWRAVMAFGLASIGFIWYLYFVSISAPTGSLFDPNLFQARILQRSIQTTIAMSLATLIVAFASHQMHSAFYMLEEKIDEVEKVSGQRSQFLANMSHEIRTPLNGIMGFCDLLKKTSLSVQQTQYATVVSKSADTLLAIVNDALELSKIDAGKFELNPQPFNLFSTVEAIVDLYQPVAIDNGLLLAAQLPKELPREYIGDEKKIRQALNLLVSNAIKFTDEGTVHISLSRCYDVTSGQNVCVSVIDTGVGIAEENFEKIFERFSQLDNSLARTADGTGLGLSLCKEIVEHMGGRIKVASVVGEGTKFTLALNLPPVENKKKSKPETSPKLSSSLRKPPKGIELETVGVNHTKSAA